MRIDGVVQHGRAHFAGRTTFLRSAVVAVGVALSLLVSAPSAADPAPCNPGLVCCPNTGGGSPCGGDGATTQGDGSSTNQGAGNPINIITGNKYQREVDLAPLPGVLGLEIIRHYNSATSNLDTPTGLFGRGWRLSYETELNLKGTATLDVVQADGSTIAFSKVSAASSRDAARNDGETVLWASADPAQGRIAARKTPRGTEYRWRWAGAGNPASAGRELLFDAHGKLLQISAPTGEFVSLQRDGQGWLVQVTDPQGRSLHFNYLDRKTAAGDRDNSQRFRGVQSIDSPVGRYAYTYNDFGAQTPSAVQAGLAAHNIDKLQLLANLIKVNLPTHHEAGQKAHAYANRGVSSSSVSRIYHYEDPAHPTLLTGITVNGQGSDGQQMLQRLSTYAYDTYGRANLSVRGEPARLETGADGQAIEPKRLVDGTGLEQVTLEWPRSGLVVLSNALGQTTRYVTAKIGGQLRIVEARGAGCATCGPSNVRYGYDRAGRLIETTRLGSDGAALESERRELDEHGRTLRIDQVRYMLGKAAASRLRVRYEYGNDPESRQPSIVAWPSVVAGKERQVRTAYNAAGQPTSTTETGYSPLDDKGRPTAGGAAITRTTTYTYVSINGRSVLREIDGPLANGPAKSPLDSDITRIDWDASASFVTATTAPGNLVSREAHDATTGRVVERTDTTGIATRYEYAFAFQERPSLVDRVGQVTRYGFDAQGRIARVSDGGQDGAKPAGRSITLQYDRASHLVAVRDGQGYKAQTTLDAEGQALVAGLYEPEQSLPLRAIYRWYDSERRIARQLRADGRLDSWRYDSTGDVAEHTDGDDVLHLTRTSDRGDARGLRLSVALAPDGMIRASMEEPGGEASHPASLDVPRIERDDFGRPVLEWRPEQGLKLRTYDAADRMVSEHRLDRGARPAGRTEQSFEAAGRLTTRLTYDAEGQLKQTVRRSYEGARLKTEADDAQISEFGYDRAGRIERTTITIQDDKGNNAYSTTLLTTYGATGEPATKTLADGQVMRIDRRADTGVASSIVLQSAFWARAHDGLARWLPDAPAATVQGWLPRTVIVQDIAFHPYNGITGYKQGNGIVTTKEFDIAGRLTALKVGADRATFAYGVGPRIRAIVAQPQGGVPSKALYDYDGFGALKEEGQARIIKTALNASTEPLNSVATVTRDSRGRTTGDGTFHYTYTEDAQIEFVEKDGKPIARYRYNASSQRVSKTLYSADAKAHTTTYYLWSSGKLIGEVEGSGEHLGNLTAQYLYLGDEIKTAPVAKLEAPAAPGNASRATRMLHIHSNYRGQPTGMTDGAQRVLWKAGGDAWGFVRARDLQGQEAALNLRLPGQYFDQETGLHDNWHRSYDARPGSALKGSYLAPDPSGYPDGPSAYGYVGGDPINRIDPAGLYEIDVHYYMTYFLARVAGISKEQALTIALASEYVDDNPATMPETKMNFTARQWYHFVMDGWDKTLEPGSRYLNPTSPQLDNLYSPTNYGFMSICARSQFFGEYLHTFVDTFSHRDQNNAPYGYRVGHTTANHDADQTYNVRDFQNNEVRTLAMEHEMFDKMFGAPGVTAAPFSPDIEATLIAFNTAGKVAGNAAPRWQDNCSFSVFCNPQAYKVRTQFELSQKIDILNQRLKAMGLESIPRYTVSIAAANRHKYMDALRHQPYPGVGSDPFAGILLPHDDCPVVGVNLGCR